MTDTRTLADLQDRLAGWKAKLILTPTKTPKACLANAVIALREAEEWKGVLAYNEFKLATIMVKPPPWRKGEDNSWMPQPWTDHEDVLTADWLQHNDISVPVAVAASAAMAAARDKTFHPVREYLEKLQWDKSERVEQFASTYLGAEDTPYHRLVSKCTLVGAVARIMTPGCKVDHVMILEGPQGIGKSTSLKYLFSPWFSDEIADLGSKDAAMQLSGVWCIELAELSSMTRGEIERVKAFISRATDRFRPSYGRNVIEVRRQTIFAGSTNSDSYLRDETGGRRFWPVRCGTINPKLSTKTAINYGPKLSPCTTPARAGGLAIGPPSIWPKTSRTVATSPTYGRSRSKGTWRTSKAYRFRKSS